MEEVEDTVVLMEVMEVLMAAVAGAVGEDLEVVVAADMIVVLTEVAEVDQEEEEAWGECLKNIQCPCCQSCFIRSLGLMKVHGV